MFFRLMSSRMKILTLGVQRYSGNLPALLKKECRTLAITTVRLSSSVRTQQTISESGQNNAKVDQDLWRELKSFRKPCILSESMTPALEKEVLSGAEQKSFFLRQTVADIRALEKRKSKPFSLPESLSVGKFLFKEFLRLHLNPKAICRFYPLCILHLNHFSLACKALRL